MITARDVNGNAIYATKDVRGVSPEAYCPCCRKRMRARVGDVRVPHWAHESGERCDEWWEEESDWRNAWMKLLSGSDKVDVENVLEKDGVRHFYDARFAGKQIAIFRRRKLSQEMFAAREQFFGDMFWFVDGKASEYKRFRDQLADNVIVKVPGCQRCYMCHASISGSTPFYCRWSACERPVLFDFASASNDDDYPLWCVLPGCHGMRIILEFPKDDLLERLKASGTLLRDSVDAVRRRIMSLSLRPVASRAPSRAVEIQTRRIEMPDSGAPVQKPAISEPVFMRPERPPPRLPPESYLPPAKGYDELVAEYRRLGYSQADAEARAKTRSE